MEKEDSGSARGPAHVWGPQAGPVHVHRGTALQRPFELVSRQVLPDGGLGAGGISQFSPDHLWGGASCEWRAHPKPAQGPVRTDCPIALQNHLRPESHGARRGHGGCVRPRDPQSTSLHVHPSQPHLPPRAGHIWGQTWPRGCPVGPTDPGGGRGGGFGAPHPKRGPGAPRDPPSLLAPSRVQGDHAYWPGGSGDDALPPQRPREAQLPKAKAASSRVGRPAEWSVPPAPP